MATLAWLLVAVIALAHGCEAYKVLVVFPMVSQSHSILGKGIVRHLLEAGHDVTYVTPYPDKNPQPNLHQIDIGKSTFQIQDEMNVTAILEQKVSMDLSKVIKFMESLNRDALMSPNFQQLLSDPSQTFDVVIAEWLYSNIYSGLGYMFSCPFIWVSSIEPHWVILSLIDEHAHPAYVADAFSNNVPPFDFKNRVKELLLQVAGMAFRYFALDTIENKQFDEILVPHMIKRGKPIISLSDVKYNASLILGNSHVSLGQATRLPQAYKPIAGYHIDTAVKPLPDNLKKLLDNAKNGLIYFSMGSIMKSKDLPESIKRDLLEVFGGLKQTVLWKFEEVLPNLPSNVHIVDWAPQQSILDAIFFSLCSRYAEKAKELSMIYHDRPVHPGKEVAHWVEHVVKTKGARHLRSPALDVPVYQKLYLDLLALVLAVLYVIKKIVVKLCCSRKATVDKKKKKN